MWRNIYLFASSTKLFLPIKTIQIVELLHSEKKYKVKNMLIDDLALVLWLIPTLICQNEKFFFMHVNVLKKDVFHRLISVDSFFSTVLGLSLSCV